MRRKGFTLAEILVVTTVSVLLVGGVMSLYLSFYSEVSREKEATERIASLAEFGRQMRSDLRRLARGVKGGCLHLDTTESDSRSTSVLTLAVLDTASGDIPDVVEVRYVFEMGKSTVVRYTPHSSGNVEQHLPLALVDLVALDSLGREQTVWLWDEILPKGLRLAFDMPDDARPWQTVGEMWFHVP